MEVFKNLDTETVAPAEIMIQVEHISESLLSTDAREHDIAKVQEVTNNRELPPLVSSNSLNDGENSAHPTSKGTESTLTERVDEASDEDEIMEEAQQVVNSASCPEVDNDVEDESDDDSYASTDDETEELLENPCTNIKVCFEPASSNLTPEMFTRLL